MWALAALGDKRDIEGSDTIKEPLRAGAAVPPTHRVLVEFIYT